MRTLLLVSLLGLSFGLTALSLFAIRITVRRQIHRQLAEDLDHSTQTFLNLQRQRHEMLLRESALLADLPSLKALMTTDDTRTIQDGGLDFWRISGGDILQLYNASGDLVASYSHAPPLTLLDQSEPAMHPLLEQPRVVRVAALGDRLYEAVAQPLAFGPRSGGSRLGYVVLGYAVDSRLAREVREAAAAEVAFTLGQQVLVSTFSPPLEAELSRRTLQARTITGDLQLGHEEYLATSIPLTGALGDVQLVVLKSYDQASRFLTQLNQWLLGLGALALLLGGIVAVSVSRRVTQPLEALVAGARAIGRGDFRHRLSTGGTAEVHELARAFDRMRIELERQQKELVDSERLATIGRMASSISHDLRHYLSAMYANAEFLSLAATPQAEREELIQEVQAAVHGMTDLLDSLLIFSQTGNALHPALESLSYIVERAASLVRSHPEARGIELRIGDLPAVEAWVDGKKLGRAVYNLLLNACQAARRGSPLPLVSLALQEVGDTLRIRIEDNGPGVPPSLRESIFQPFVSRGKENGIGLGLTLAQHIAQEHGGSVLLEESAAGKTVFSIVLSQHALNLLRGGPTAARTILTRDTEAREAHERSSP